jgi:hypothetical protein
MNCYGLVYSIRSALGLHPGDGHWHCDRGLGACGGAAKAAQASKTPLITKLLKYVCFPAADRVTLNPGFSVRPFFVCIRKSPARLLPLDCSPSGLASLQKHNSERMSVLCVGLAVHHSNAFEYTCCCLQYSILALEHGSSSPRSSPTMQVGAQSSDRTVSKKGFVTAFESRQMNLSTCNLERSSSIVLHF